MANPLLLCAALALLWAAPLDAQSNEDDAFNLARNLFRDARDYPTAAELFAEFIRNYPDSEHLADARLMLARAYGKSQRCNLAIKAYEEFYQRFPEHLSTAEARRERAACLAQEGRHLEAARAYEEVQRLFSAGEFAASSLLDAAGNYRQAGKLEQAQKLYERLIAEYDDHPLVHKARYQLAQLQMARGRPGAAQQLLRRIAAVQPPLSLAPAALYLDGHIDLFLGALEKSRQTFARLHQRFPASPQSDSAYVDLATYLYEKGRFAAAVEAFAAAREHLGDGQLEKRALLGLAEAYRRNGQYREALELYRALLPRLDPAQSSYARAQLGAAIAYGRAGQPSAAISLFQELLLRAPQAPEGRASLREMAALHRRLGDRERAITYYRRYLEVAAGAPDRDQVELALAQVLAASGYDEEAIPLYRALAEGSSDLAAEAQLGLARAFEQSALPRLALREYRTFLERFPTHARAPRVRRRLEYLRHFAVLDRAGLDRAVRQATIDQLSGRPQQQVLFELARALYSHRDFANAVRSFETYVARYPGSPEAPQAQYGLAESLFKWGRQRQLEDRAAAGDSLQELARQEFRILAQSGDSTWAPQARLRLRRMEAAAAPEAQRDSTLSAGLSAFLARGAAPDSLRARALLLLGDAQRRLGARDTLRLKEAMATYHLLQAQFLHSPLRARARLGLGLCHALRGEYSAAADSLKRFLQDEPERELAPRALLELGRTLLELNQPAAAASRLQELLLLYPAFPQRRAAQRQLAETHFRLGEYGRAITLLRQLLEDNTDAGGRLRFRLAQAYQLHGELKAALALYRQILRQVPAAAADSIVFAQGQLLVALERPEEAVQAFVQVRDRFASSPLAAAAALQAAHLLFSLERYAEAHAAYQPLLESNGDARTRGQDAVALFRLDRLKEARRAAAAFAGRFKDNARWPQRFRLEEGRHYLRLKNYKKALELFRQLENQGGEEASEAAYFAVLALLEQNRAAPSEETGARVMEALGHFVKTYPHSPRAPSVYLRLGDYRFALGNYLPAAGAYKAVLEAAAPAELKERAIWQLLQSYQKAYEYEDAHQTALRLMREFPAHPRIRQVQLILGILFEEKGQYTKAIAQLEKVLEWAEGDDAAETYYHIGVSQQNLGEYRRAIQAYYQVRYYGAEASSGWITTADYQRARCHEKLSEFETAIGIYENIVQREGGNSPFGSEARERISALRRRLPRG